VTTRPGRFHGDYQDPLKLLEQVNSFEFYTFTLCLPIVKISAHQHSICLHRLYRAGTAAQVYPNTAKIQADGELPPHPALFSSGNFRESPLTDPFSPVFPVIPVILFTQAGICELFGLGMTIPVILSIQAGICEFFGLGMTIPVIFSNRQEFVNFSVLE
jgi:hypothetical protein